MVTGQPGQLMVPVPRHAIKEPIQGIDHVRTQLQVMVAITVLDHQHKLRLALWELVLYILVSSIKWRTYIWKVHTNLKVSEIVLFSWM